MKLFTFLTMKKVENLPSPLPVTKMCERALCMWWGSWPKVISQRAPWEEEVGWWGRKKKSFLSMYFSRVFFDFPAGSPRSCVCVHCLLMLERAPTQVWKFKALPIATLAPTFATLTSKILTFQVSMQGLPTICICTGCLNLTLPNSQPTS